MRSVLSAFPTEKLVLHKSNGTTIEVIALVDKKSILSENIDVVIEEGDIYERILPNGAKEFFRITDRGFVKGHHGIPDTYQSTVTKLTEEEMKEASVVSTTMDKPHKLFISHSGKDKDYMIALSEMLEDIGMPDGSFVCTSVPGHGIPGGANIFDWLREQFLSCNLRVLFALSKNYYSSAASLNEMGAAWVTKAEDTLLLLPGFQFKEIEGCVDPRKIGISFEMDYEELNHRLNELKDILFSEHNLPPISQARWERHRNKFVKSVFEIAKGQEPQNAESEHSSYEPKVGIDDVGSIPLETAFLLVYAAAGNGQIIIAKTLSSPPEILADGKRFMSNMSQRESARWQEALDMLISWNWVKQVGNKGDVFELTGTGYKKADWLKDGMQINTDNEPVDEIKCFE